MMASQKEDLGYKDLVVRSIRTLDGGLDSREYLGVKTRILQAESEIHRINGVMGDFDLSAVKWFLEIRYKKSLLQPEPPVVEDPSDWFLYIPAGEGYGWQTRALKYADGTLVSTWEEAIRVPTTDDLDDIIDGSAILDGAIEKAKLSSGFLLEHETISSEVFPYGLSEMSDIARIDTLSGEASTLATGLMEAVSDTEEGLLANNIVLDGNITAVSTLQSTVDGLTSLVGELIDGGGGQEVNLTMITQNKANIALSALSGKWVNYDTGPGELETWSMAKINILNDQISLVVESDGGTGWNVASVIITDDNISSKVAEVIETDAGVIAAVSDIVQTSDAIMLRVREAESLATEMIDQALAKAEAGIYVSTRRIELAVQAQAETDTITRSLIVIEADRITSEVSRASAAEGVLASLIVIEADRITSEVSRASAAEGVLASQIISTADSINLSVWGTEAVPGPLPVASGEIAILKDSVAARVQGGGSSAFLGLQITLPLEITADTMTAMSNAAGSSSAMVLAVYAPGTDGIYRLKPGASIQDFDALRTVLRAADLLGSRFTVEADELVFAGGDVMFPDGKLLVGNVLGAATTTQVSDAELAAKDAMADKLGFDGWGEMELSARAGGTIISGGLINTDIINAEAVIAKVGYFEGEINAHSGVFRGSIEAGPLTLSISPPGSSTYSQNANDYRALVVSKIAAHLGVHSGKFVCTGTIDGQSVDEIEISYSATQFKAAYKDFRNYHSGKAMADWWEGGSVTRIDATLKGYLNGSVVTDWTGVFHRPGSTWTKLWHAPWSGSYGYPYGDGMVSGENPPDGNNPQVLLSASEALANRNLSLAFNAASFTYKLTGLPDWNTLLPAGTVYKAADGANYRLMIKG
jgi:hypothetical protein